MDEYVLTTKKTIFKADEYGVHVKLDVQAMLRVLALAVSVADRNTDDELQIVAVADLFDAMSQPTGGIQGKHPLIGDFHSACAFVEGLMRFDESECAKAENIKKAETLIAETKAEA